MKKIFSLFILALLASWSAHAQSDKRESTLPPEVKSQVNRTIDEAINSISIFTSQNTVSSGQFRIKESDSPNITVDVIRLPFEFPLIEKSIITPFIDGNVGYFKAVERIPPEEGAGDNDFSRIETWSGGLGTGFHVKPNETLTFTPAFSAFYSHTRNYYDYNNEFSQTILEPYGKELFGWDVETITYSPSFRGQSDLPIGSAVLKLWSKYSHLFNRSISTNSATIDIDSNTGLWQNSAGVRIPLNLCIKEHPLATRTTLTRTDIYRSARRGLEFNYFYELTFDLIAEVKDSWEILREISIGGSYSFGEDFSGWRVGLGYEF